MTTRLAIAVIAGALFAAPALAAGEVEIKHPSWTFSGPFGTYDNQQLQRGYQVYREVCSGCHSMNLVAFRNLAEDGGPGFTEDQVKALAAEFEVTDGPDESGDMFERPAWPSDRLPAPFANEAAAKASNNGALPPDFSLIAKARGVERGFPTFIFDIFTQYQEGGPDYLYSLLTGSPEGSDTEADEQGLYENHSFIGAPSLAMAPPLSDELVTYAQNADEDPNNDLPETVDQYAKDVTAFLMWAAEPHLEARKAMGLKVMIFLIIFSGLLYYSKKKVWSEVAH
jgi:ubiquinol-cytochrome c reductase cytochrome b/c1 subunit/ubiquinol-cytochrome c reductase cytochrome c1 subunit